MTDVPSWHIALFALMLADHAAERVDVFRVVSMLLIHDLVEIDCGDTPLFDEAAAATQAVREAAAARRLFGLLPAEQAAEFLALWHEFGAAVTANAQFAKSIDRLQPILQNHAVGGGNLDRLRCGRAARARADLRYCRRLGCALECGRAGHRGCGRGWLKPSQGT